MKTGRARILARVGGYALSALIILFIILVLSGRVRVAVVEGKSMEPTMHTGDLVLLERKPPQDIEPGDIVVYKAGNRFIIHRVIEKFVYNGRYCFVVKGDNNPVPDPGFPQCRSRGIPYDAIVGVVLSYHGMAVKVPYLGGISVLLKG